MVITTHTLFTSQAVVGSVRLEGLRDCRAVLAPCGTAAYVDGCRGCTIYAASHQLRVHGCAGVDLFVRVNSHPIIEDCSDLGFAPYDVSYDALDSDLQARSSPVITISHHHHTPS